jgi:hypothetical protein
MTCDVPEYATEEGYSITDNICLKPRELEIEAIITNSPVTWAEQHAASSSRVETMVEELRQLWLKKTPVSFTAAGDSYENMCITSITAPRTVEDGSSTRLTIKLKQGLLKPLHRSSSLSMHAGVRVRIHHNSAERQCAGNCHVSRHRDIAIHLGVSLDAQTRRHHINTRS